jgi:hypothetical protein
VLVTIIGVVMILVGMFQAIIGVVTFVARNDTTFLSEADITSSQATTFAIMLMVFGVVSVLLGGALLRGSKVARMLVGVFEILQIAGAVWVAVAGHDNQRVSAIATMIGAAVVLYFLFGTEKAKEFFA